MRMKIAAFSFLLVLVAFPCAAQEVNSIFDQQVAASELHVRRIAVIPNRLPLVLQEAEMWRQKNWEIIRRLLEAKGFDVVPYEDTVDAAKTAGLPLEDTFSSEDKFHTLCQLTGADLVIMPYYGTSFRSVNFLFLINTYIYSSIVSYQFYSPEVNLFFHRADAQGEDRFSTGWAPLIGMGLTLLPLVVPSGDFKSMSTMTSIGGIVSLGGSLYDLIQTASPPNKRWERGFEKAIAKALEPFLASLSPSALGWQAAAEAEEDLARDGSGSSALAASGSEAEAGEDSEIDAGRVHALEKLREGLVRQMKGVEAIRAKRVGQARGWLYAGLASLVGTGIAYGVGRSAMSSYLAATDPAEVESYRTTVELSTGSFYVTTGLGAGSLLIGLFTQLDTAKYRTDTVKNEIREIDLELSRLGARSR
jgi:hypothetical protein